MRDELLTAQEAAQRFGISPRTIGGWKKRGQLAEHSKGKHGESLYLASELYVCERARRRDGRGRKRRVNPMPRTS